MKFVAQVMIFGVLAGLFFGLVEYSSGVTTALSFHSAGGTTQSSIYLGMAIITAFGLMTTDSDNTFLNAGIMYISLFLMGVAMLYMGSRGAILAILIFTFWYSFSSAAARFFLHLLLSFLLL
jgi:hypothetical protein